MKSIKMSVWVESCDYAWDKTIEEVHLELFRNILSSFNRVTRVVCTNNRYTDEGLGVRSKLINHLKESTK